MSLITERFLMCDGLNCSDAFGVDNGSMTGAQHREMAKAEGWSGRAGADYCPSCTRENTKAREKARLKGPLHRVRIT